MPVDTSFHNTYLFPKYPGQNPFGVPGRLVKGHIFALRTPPSTTSTGDDGEGVGDQQENEATDPTVIAENTFVADTGTWNEFPTNLHMEFLDDSTIEDVSGNYYEDNWNFIGAAIAFFPVNEEGDWCDLNGNAQPEDLSESERAAWYGSVLDQIPQWKTFTDDSGEQYIYHLFEDNGLGYIESYASHTNPNDTEGVRAMHLFEVEQSVPDPTPTTGSGGARDKQLANGGFNKPQVDWTRYKTFQFNPPAWEFDYQMMGIAPADTTQTGGTASDQAPGFVNTSIKLSFDRTQEVYAATNGTNPNVDPIFAKVGVQQDVFEIFKIMMDPREYAEATVSTAPPVNGTVATSNGIAPKSMYEMHKVMFDIGLGGSRVTFAPIAVVFNDYFTVQGYVTGIHVAYAAFNFKLVPTIAAVTLDISVLNVAQANSSTILNPTATQLSPPSTSLSPAVPSASGGSTGRARQITLDMLRDRTLPRQGGRVITYTAE